MIGKRVQQLRQEKGLSITELADRAGVAKSYLSSIERGIQKNPSIQFLTKISAVLDVSLEALIQRDFIDEEKEDREWHELVKEVMDSGISKEQLRRFVEMKKWKI